VEKPACVVLDAYALGALPDLSAPQNLDGRLALTPNPREAERLLGRSLSPVHETDVRAISDRYAAAVVCAGWIAAPDGRVWRDSTGHAGLGTSGSGDVLAGVVAGLLARGADPAQAACWGSHLHGAAGDRLAARIGRLGFLARELLDELPALLTELSEAR
jgi:NAD(P)H-hydrate repair Nnr-like enzyme with NAD(P)H-hydrate dehydratase domain